MPYKCKKQLLAAAKRWRDAHPGYMSNYYWTVVKPLDAKLRQKRPAAVSSSTYSR